ncbi:MAG: peroxiredoxin [Beijerinckiaceae bacterium]|nr:peroxiredoxin [Beijerinckiaceae bacterium]
MPEDDGAARHLTGLAMPSLVLEATIGPALDLAALPAGRTVLFAYPMTGRPGVALPEGWDDIPGARGCTPQNCSFRDSHAVFTALGVGVLGLSTQTSDYQREMAARLHLPYPVLSDAAFALTDALRLPTFEVDGVRLLRRLTLVIADGLIEHVFYPVFPPDRSTVHVTEWLGARQAV